MFIKKLFVAALALGAAAAALGQGTISMAGLMSVQEGGSGMIRGLVTHRPVGGDFIAAFDTGRLVEVRSVSVDAVSIPGVTAFFSGTAIAVIRGRNGPRLVRAAYMVMVDDLAGLSFPDQFFMRIDTSEGETYVRHGRIRLGDIIVTLP